MRSRAAKHELRHAARRVAIAVAVLAGVAVARAQVLPGGVEQDITYATVGGVALKLDVYYPQQWNGPAPLAVFVHGGGWTSGDKTGSAGYADKDELLARGYVVASVDYRLAPEYRWPAQIEDVKAAIRFLRANAARFGVDPERLGVWGSSAGGHLVSMVGLTDASAGFDDSGGNFEQSSRPLAVVDEFGPTDLTQPGFVSADPVVALLGPNAPLALLTNASPVAYISLDDPPFLIVQGDSDATVPPSQSQELYQRLHARGLTATLVMVANCGHAFTPVGGDLNPSRSEISTMIADFFDRYVKSAWPSDRVRRHLPHAH
jgi:acetyl esterase/lipase